MARQILQQIHLIMVRIIACSFWDSGMAAGASYENKLWKHRSINIFY